MEANNYRINQPDFRAESWQASRHDGKQVWISTCYELIDGHWEGFVAMTTKQPKDDCR